MQNFANSKNLYLSVKRDRTQRIQGSVLALFIFELQQPFTFKEVRAESLTEEIRVNPLDNEQILWLTHDSILNAINATNQVNKTYYLRHIITVIPTSIKEFNWNFFFRKSFL